MDYRQRKQVIIISIILVFFGLVGAGVFFRWFYQPATCDDGKQNQKEEGVDCGGPCQMTCERLTIKNLQVEWAKDVLLANNTYDLVARVINLNPNYGLAQFNYTFKVYDDSGQVIAQRKGSNFILPAQEKYLIETSVSVNGQLGNVELTITEQPKTVWQRLKAEFQTPNIYVHDQEVKASADSSGVVQARGIIKNDSNFDFSIVYVSILISDGDGRIIGVNKTDVRSLLAGENRDFSVQWNTPLAIENSSKEMIAETNLLLDDNFMRRYGTQEKFQEY